MNIVFLGCSLDHFRECLFKFGTFNALKYEENDTFEDKKKKRLVKFLWMFIHKVIYGGCFRHYHDSVLEGQVDSVKDFLSSLSVSDEAMILTILYVKRDEIVEELRRESVEQDKEKEKQTTAKDSAPPAATAERTGAAAAGETADASNTPEYSEAFQDDNIQAPTIASKKKPKRKPTGRRKKITALEGGSTELGKQDEIYVKFFELIKSVRELDGPQRKLDPMGWYKANLDKFLSERQEAKKRGGGSTNMPPLKKVRLVANRKVLPREEDSTQDVAMTMV